MRFSSIAWLFGLACAAFLLGLGQADAFVGIPGLRAVGADLPAEAHMKLTNSLDRLAVSQVTPERLSQQSVLGLSIDCLLGAEMLARGDDRFLPGVQQRAARLIEIGRTFDPSAPSWGAAAGADKVRCPQGQFAFDKCEGASVPFGPESAMAIACLARAGAVTHNMAWLDTARAGAGYWRQHGRFGAPCANCFSYAPSGNPEDAGRRVRNINVTLAMADALVQSASGQVSNYTNGVLKTEQNELHFGNQGYLSTMDPQWARAPAEAQRIENHIAPTVAALIAIAHATHSPLALSLARSEYGYWAHCSNTACQTNGCKYWAANAGACSETATFAHCLVRNHDPEANAKCLQAIAANKTLNSEEMLFILTGDSPPAG